MFIVSVFGSSFLYIRVLCLCFSFFWGGGVVFGFFRKYGMDTMQNTMSKLCDFMHMF